MSANHTPGPYEAITDNQDGRHQRVPIMARHPDFAKEPPPYHPLLGVVYFGHGHADRATSEATAKLWAASPELLAALEEAGSMLAKYSDYADAMKEFSGRGCEPMSTSGYKVDYLQAMITKAIQKAKRETI